MPVRIPTVIITLNTARLFPRTSCCERTRASRADRPSIITTGSATAQRVNSTKPGMSRQSIPTRTPKPVIRDTATSGPTS